MSGAAGARVDAWLKPHADAMRTAPKKPNRHLRRLSRAGALCESEGAVNSGLKNIFP